MLDMLTGLTEDDARDPEFHAWVEQVGKSFVPDPEDWNRDTLPVTDEQEKQLWRLAVGTKFVRLWREWKATQS